METKMKTKLKLNDNVVVVSGSSKGKRGKILYINKTKGLVLVEGVNKKHKAVKASQENPKGGITQKEFPIQASNVMFFCDKCKKGVRLQVADSAGSSTDLTSKTKKDKSRKCSKCGKSY